MKLPVKHGLFEELKAGRRTIDYRDAHITFVDEETGETLVKRIDSVGMIEVGKVPESIRKFVDGIFTDEWVITFHWGDAKSFKGGEMTSSINDAPESIVEVRTED